MKVHFYVTKLSSKEKIDIYQKRLKGVSIKTLFLEYGITEKNIEYLCRLIKLHGDDILRLTNV